MSENEVLDLWKKGLSKNKVAEIYRRRYNQQIKVIRAEVVNRHAGKFISSYEGKREELTAKDLAIYKANEIKQLCGDLKYDKIKI